MKFISILVSTTGYEFRALNVTKTIVNVLNDETCYTSDKIAYEISSMPALYV